MGQAAVLITPEYLRQNLLLHDSEPTYGTSSWQYAPAVRTLCKAYGTQDVLDYGCGKGRLADELEFPIQEYDPAIPGRDALPLPADIVVCGDVMEHIEPECVDDVLKHIHRLTRMCAYWIIATRPAAKSLPDGRNCHLIVENDRWWRQAMCEHKFIIIASKTGRKGEAIFTTTPV